jgi:hypothetical protein
MSLRHGLRWFSAKRRRTVSRDSSSCLVSLTIAPANSSSVQRARPSGGFEQAVATSRASSLPVSLRAAPLLFAERGFQIAFHKAALGPVHRRPADRDAGGDIVITDASIGGQ